MTRSLRRRHLAMWLLLGPLALGVLAAAILLRPAPMRADGFPPAERAP